VTESIDGFTPNGIRIKPDEKNPAGKEFEFDVIILATGFSVLESSKAFIATGKEGKVLDQEWKDEPRLFLGTAYVRKYCLNFHISIVSNSEIYQRFSIIGLKYKCQI
jgi:hypothetical protein